MEQNVKKKISCGGFMLGEGLVLSEDGKTLSVSGGGGGSVPKPLTFDYMPEGYPTKSDGNRYSYGGAGTCVYIRGWFLRGTANKRS